MFVHIEKHASAPISRQIVDQIRAQCLSGRLKPGTQIPSVRQLARDLAISQNTVLRVYEKLAAERLLDMRHGEGTFVAQQLPTGQLSTLRIHFADEFSQLVRQGRLLGLDADTLRVMLDTALPQIEAGLPSDTLHAPGSRSH